MGTDSWAFSGAPPLRAGGAPVTLVEGATFCICSRSGDISALNVRAGAEQGLFFRDTRFVSQFELAVDGEGLDPLAAYCPTPYAGTFMGRRPPRVGTADSTLLVVRRRFVGSGLLEHITIRNLGREPAAIGLTLTVDTDFAGLFEVKEGRTRHREGIVGTADDSGLHFHYAMGRDSRGVAVSGSDNPTATEGRLRWQLVVAAHDEATITVEVTPEIDGLVVSPAHRPGQAIETSQPATALAAWRMNAPVITTPDDVLPVVLQKSAEDLGVLRISDPEHPERVVVAAGAPWFMTLFGRDSLLTSWMLLPLDRTVALGTLQTLAQMQGQTVDPRSEEQPGRILHEVRHGLDAEQVLGGGNVYYGSVDATPLFVMLLGELSRWGLDRSELDALLPHADRALEWIENFGDRDGDGFVEYHRATDRGLVNQGWKDSFDAINFAAGGLAEPPIALAEVQGYVYAAYLARSDLANEVGDPSAAQHWSDKAARLKRRFNEVFWLPDREYFALALDAEKRPVDALTSNMGHCLWTGIVDDDKAAQVAAHLLGPDMFTGFGVRTLASSMGAYNPMSYHNGSVWPHDNALVAAGLMRYGFVDEAQRIALGLLDAARQMGDRLPELFCGFDRAEFPSPIPYPTSCDPQAWAAATPLFLLRSLLRFDPWIPGAELRCAPAVPDQWLPLSVGRLHLAGSTIDVAVDRDGFSVGGVPETVEVIREPLALSRHSTSSRAIRSDQARRGPGESGNAVSSHQG